jgi:hypothetical protein
LNFSASSSVQSRPNALRSARGKALGERLIGQHQARGAVPADRRQARKGEMNMREAFVAARPLLGSAAHIADDFNWNAFVSPAESSARMRSSSPSIAS